MKKAIMKDEGRRMNPFLCPQPGFPNCETVDAEGRIEAVKRFDADQCHAVLALPSVQVSVRKAAERRLRKLDTKIRSCLRCGCTDIKACPDGCEWVAGSDICSTCLSYGEEALYMELIDAVTMSDTRAESKQAELQLRLFGKYLQEATENKPIPYKLLAKGGTK
jgi:hypothetical protein